MTNDRIIYLVIGRKSVIQIYEDSLPYIKGFIVPDESKTVTMLYKDGEVEHLEGTSWLDEDQCGRLHTIEEVMHASFNSRFISFCNQPIAVFNTDKYTKIQIDEFGDVYISNGEIFTEVASLGNVHDYSQEEKASVHCEMTDAKALSKCEILQNYCFGDWKRFFTYVLGGLRKCYEYVAVDGNHNLVLFKEYPQYGDDGFVIPEQSSLIYQTPPNTMNALEVLNVYTINRFSDYIVPWVDGQL